MPKKTTHAFGNKSDLIAAIEAGKVNEFDEVFFTDTHESGWINSAKEFVMHTPRTQEAHTLVGTSLGALPEGSVIPAGKSLDEIMAMATQKAIHPTYTKPTVSVANNAGTNAGSFESGTTINPKIKVTFNKNDAGALTGLSVTKAGVEVGTSAVSPYEFVGDDFVIGDESVIFKATASYGEGETKNDNLGNPDDYGKIAAGSVSSSNYTYNVQRKMFYGTGVGNAPELTSDVIRALTNNRMNPASGQTVDLSVAAGSQYILVALPAPRKLTMVTYVDAGDKGMLGSFTQSIVQVADARGGDNGLKDYNVYLYQLSTPTEATMNFQFTLG